MVVSGGQAHESKYFEVLVEEVEIKGRVEENIRINMQETKDIRVRGYGVG